jgi:hypothetical protein
MTSDQFDLYTSIHKGQRMVLYNIAVRAGAISHSNRTAVEELYNDLKELREETHSRKKQ